MPGPVKFEPLKGVGVPTPQPPQPAAPPPQRPPQPMPPPQPPPSSFFTAPPTASFTAPRTATPAPKPVDFRRTDTTRYLSAAVYSHKLVRDRVLEHIVDEDHKAIVASYGVDIATVAGHCLLARRKKMVRDGVICALTILAWIAMVAVDPILAALLLQLVVWGIVFYDSYTMNYDILGARFTRTTFDPDYGYALLNAEQQATLQQIAAVQRGNVVVYGGFSPFVGSGFDIGGWSFTTKVNKGKEEHGKRLTPLPVHPEELHHALTKAIFDLELEGVNVEDKLYVDGQEIRDDQTFLPHPLSSPVASVDAATVRHFIEHSTAAVRHYKCIQSISWRGELVLSIFIRFTKIKNNLFAEASYFLLPPLQGAFHKVDCLRPSPTVSEVGNLLLISAFKAVVMPIYSSLVTLSNLLRPFTKWRADREVEKMIRDNPAFNYGALTTIRESFTSGNYRRYFQRLDKEMNLKIIERQILDCIVDFLESKNIDTSDLSERKETILNNGVIISGGTVQAQSIAVGKQAVAQVNKLANAIGFSPLKMPQPGGQSPSKG